MTYTILFTLNGPEPLHVEHVPAWEVSGILVSIKENHGQITDIVAERH